MTGGKSHRTLSILAPLPQQVGAALGEKITIRRLAVAVEQARRAVSRSNSSSRCDASRTKLRTQPTAASRSPPTTGATRCSVVAG
jgi:hypothetical protein